MSTTLTPEDLSSIKSIIDDAIEQSDLRTAAAFVEVHEKFAAFGSDLDDVKSDLMLVKSDLLLVKSDLVVVKSDLDEVKTDLTLVKSDLDDVKSTVKIIQRVQAAEIERADKQESHLQRMRKTLRSI